MLSHPDTVPSTAVQTSDFTQQAEAPSSVVQAVDASVQPSADAPNTVVQAVEVPGHPVARPSTAVQAVDMLSHPDTVPSTAVQTADVLTQPADTSSVVQAVDASVQPADAKNTEVQSFDVLNHLVGVPSTPDFRLMLPTPRAKDVRQKVGVKRKVDHAVVATSSPFKDKLQAAHAEKSAKCVKVATATKKRPQNQSRKVRKVVGRIR